MAVIRINACRAGSFHLAGAPEADAGQALSRALAGLGRGAPVCVLIHGFRYTWKRDRAPDCADPHSRLYRTDRFAPCGRRRPSRAAWAERLGFSEDDPRDGLSIAFAWEARPERPGLGAFARVYDRAGQAGVTLARLLGLVAAQRPDLDIDCLTHSLGARVALTAATARPDLPWGRLIFMGAAEYAGEARAALDRLDRAGTGASVYNLLGRANDLYDALFTLAAPRPARPGDRVLGAGGLGRADPRWLDLQLDHPETARWLARRGITLARAAERLSHWHFYGDPGAMEFYRAILRERASTAPSALRASGMPDAMEPRWSRLWPSSGLQPIADGEGPEPAGALTRI